MNKVELIKKFRAGTGLGLLQCKNALIETNWNLEEAIKYVKNNIRPSEKPTGSGAIFSYIHHNMSTGSLLELLCGTDFVARTEDFQKLGNTVAMHVTAMKPQSVEELLTQPYFKDNSISVGDFIAVVAARFNEPIKVSRFKNFILGGDDVS